MVQRLVWSIKIKRSSDHGDKTGLSSPDTEFDSIDRTRSHQEKPLEKPPTQVFAWYIHQHPNWRHSALKTWSLNLSSLVKITSVFASDFFYFRQFSWSLSFLECMYWVRWVFASCCGCTLSMHQVNSYQFAILFAKLKWYFSQTVCSKNKNQNLLWRRFWVLCLFVSTLGTAWHQNVTAISFRFPFSGNNFSLICFQLWYFFSWICKRKLNELQAQELQPKIYNLTLNKKKQSSSPWDFWIHVLIL